MRFITNKTFYYGELVSRRTSAVLKRRSRTCCWTSVICMVDVRWQIIITEANVVSYRGVCDIPTLAKLDTHSSCHPRISYHRNGLSKVSKRHTWRNISCYKQCMNHYNNVIWYQWTPRTFQLFKTFYLIRGIQFCRTGNKYLLFICTVL